MAEPYLKKEEFSVIGKRGLGRRDGYEKASGTGLFTRDIILPGMLYAKQLTCPFAHARIKSIDTSKAEALPGVRDILKWDDPELAQENYIPGWYWGLQYEGLLEDTGHYFGQPMGFAVCADTEDLCDEALKLVEIDWEELPFCIDWDEALKAGATVLDPEAYPESNLRADYSGQHGDVEAGLNEADKIIPFVWNEEEDTWAGVEALACVARWRGDYLDVWVHNQIPHTTHSFLSKYWPMCNISVHSPYHGAQFGGMNWILYCKIFPLLACIIAKKAGRPVKFLYDGSHFYGHGLLAGKYEFEIGVKNDGTITAVKIDATYATAETEQFHENTRIPNILGHTTVPYINRCHKVCYRHGQRFTGVITQAFNHVASELGLDPTEVALKNDGCEGHDMVAVAEYKQEHGFPDRDSLRECIEAGKEAMGWDEKWHLPGTKELPNGKMHGLGFSWSQEWTCLMGDKAGSCAGLGVRADGTVSIFTQHAEGGWGSQTAYSKVAADELGMKFEDVNQLIHDDPYFAAHDAGCGGALISTANSIAKAARELKQKILKAAVTDLPRWTHLRSYGAPATFDAPFKDLSAEELDIEDSVVFEKANPSNKKTMKEIAQTVWGDQTNYLFREPLYTWAWTRGPEPIPDHMYALPRQCHMIEIEVDPETGEVDITKVVNVNDVGKAIDPEAINGQQYGGSYMGLGISLQEQVYYDPQTGVKLNDNLITYPFLSMRDISGPMEQIILETGLGWGPYGSAGCAECIGAMTSSITGAAIYNAIGKWVDFPTTPDKILKALGKI